MRLAPAFALEAIVYRGMTRECEAENAMLKKFDMDPGTGIATQQS
ncbi:hypothetical protein [Mesorhizobium sp. M0118]